MTPELKGKADQVNDLLKDCDKPDYHAVLKNVAGRRPWRPRRKGLDAVLDQLGHAVWAAALVLPLLLWSSH